MNYHYRLDSIFIGLLFQTVQNIVGILTGPNAIDYYGQVHLSNWNSNIHTLFMPFTCFGFLLGVPAIFGLNRKDANTFQDCVYLFYTAHYLTISFKIGFAFALLYYLVLDKARHMYRNNLRYIFYGLVTSTTTLVIQEVVGHYYGGDEPSRFEGILNAILYANFYAIQNLLA